MTSVARTLVITGMHRSGTSLLASVVRQAGIDLGADLMPGGRGNRRGHFEDMDFHRFHEAFLERREVSLFAVTEGWSPDPSPIEEKGAGALVAARAGRPVWGFKDPKTSLFLDFWHSRLNDPIYLLVYRHPVEVALSLIRRGLELEIQQDPRIAFQAWRAYNERLLRFHAAHPGRCLLWHVRGATRSLEAALGNLEERLGVPLDRSGADGFFHRQELIGLQAADIDWPELLPAAFDLYRRLNEAADLPVAELDGSPPPGDRSRQERELLESNEHLLAAVLRPPVAGAPAAATAQQRGDYTLLRLVAAQREEDNRGLKERLGTVEGEMADLKEELTVLKEEMAARKEEIAARKEEMATLKEEMATLKSSVAIRIVHLYWAQVRRLRRLLSVLQRRS